MSPQYRCAKALMLRDHPVSRPYAKSMERTTDAVEILISDPIVIIGSPLFRRRGSHQIQPWG